MTKEKWVDWSVLDIPGVEEAAHLAAQKVINAAYCRPKDEEDLPREQVHWIKFSDHLTLEDAIQEASISVSHMADKVRKIVATKSRAFLITEIYRNLQDDLTVMVQNASNTQPVTMWDAEMEEDRMKVSVPSPPKARLYDRELIETLLPSVWDRSYCYGIQQENAPDVDMPRAAGNKATGNMLAAHLVDIRVGWEKAPLFDVERACLLLRFGLDWTQVDIAFNQNISQPTVSRRIESGIGKIAAQLNGDDMLEFLDG